MLNLKNHEPDIDKIYLYANDPYEATKQLLINKRESAGLRYLNGSKAFIEYSNDMSDIYQNIEEYNRKKNQKYWLYLMMWWPIRLLIKNLFQ